MCKMTTLFSGRMGPDVVPDQGCVPEGSCHSGPPRHPCQCLSDPRYKRTGSCRPRSGYLLSSNTLVLLTAEGQKRRAAAWKTPLPSPSMSTAQASPSPLLSVSVWSVLASKTQLSQRSPTSSLSVSYCAGLYSLGQLS